MLCENCVRGEVKVYTGDVDELSGQNRVVAARIPSTDAGEEQYCIIRCRRARQNVIKPADLVSCESHEPRFVEGDHNGHEIELSFDMERPNTDY